MLCFVFVGQDRLKYVGGIKQLETGLIVRRRHLIVEYFIKKGKDMHIRAKVNMELLKLSTKEGDAIIFAKIKNKLYCEIL